MGIFDDELIDREKASRDLYPRWSVMNNLSENVINSKVGLQELLQSVKDFKELTRNEPESIIEGKINLDKIALLFENFIEEFKPLYSEFNSLYVSEKLTEDDEGKMNFGIDGVSSINTSFGWNKKSR